jgi:hypothetical protein
MRIVELDKKDSPKNAKISDMERSKISIQIVNHAFRSIESKQSESLNLGKKGVIVFLAIHCQEAEEIESLLPFVKKFFQIVDNG